MSYFCDQGVWQPIMESIHPPPTMVLPWGTSRLRMTVAERHQGPLVQWRIQPLTLLKYDD